MLGHRKLNATDYLGILKRRRWLIAVPIILGPMIAYAISYMIPATYVSQTLVLVQEQQVDPSITKAVVTSSLDSRLSSMREQILSRSRIQPIVERYNLYPSKGVSMDQRVDMARKAIVITVIRPTVNTTRSVALPGFFITFAAADPRTAQLVCSDITTLFVTANLQARENSAEGTTQFLKDQLEDAKRNLDEQDAKLAAFQRQYIGKLPGEETGNMSMLTSLNTRLEANTQALTQLQQNKSYQESMLTQMIQNAQAFTPVAGNPNAPLVQAPQAEQAELQQLLLQQADLNTHYTADHPDVIAINRKIADLRKRMTQVAPAPAPVASTSTSITAPNRNDSPAIQQLRAQLRASEFAIQDKQRQQGQLQSAEGLYQERIASSPQVEEQFKDLNRGYTTAQKFYDDLSTKMNTTKMATDLERRQQGENFTIMDGANLPDSPTFPNRQLFAIGGFGVGLVFGLALAAFLEYKDTALRTEQDVWAFTKLPTLAVIAYAGEITSPGGRPGMFSHFRRLFTRKAPVDALSKATG